MRLRVDSSRPLSDQPGRGHNRWHPDLTPVLTVSPGEVFTIETLDGFDGQLTRASRSEDIPSLALGRAHPLTGPIFVEGAEPGDLLEVELLEYESAEFGVSACVPGLGLLSDLFPDPYVVHWELDTGFARSDALPGVAVPESIFAGVLGVAPSHRQMEAMRRREEELAARGGAVAASLPADAVPPDAADGLRTIASPGDRREPRRPGPRGRQPGAAAGERHGRPALDRRPALRAGRRRGMRHRDRDRRRGDGASRADPGPGLDAALADVRDPGPPGAPMPGDDGTSL